MIAAMRRARTTSRAIAFSLVLALFVSFPRQNQAFLTELIVGGELAMSAVTLIGQALPQIALVAANVLTLVKTGQAIADTLKNIAKTLFPGKDGANAGPPPPSLGSAPASPPSSDAPGIPEIPMDSEAKGSETSLQAPAVPANGELKSAIDAVVDAYRKKNDLYLKLAGLPGGPKGRSPLADAYSSTVNAHEQAVSNASTLVLDAVREGNRDTLDSFAGLARHLEATDRAAVLPVINRVLDRGKPFATLNGESAASFDELTSLHGELTK